MKRVLLLVVVSWWGSAVGQPVISTPDEETPFIDGSRSQTDFRFADSTAQWTVWRYNAFIDTTYIYTATGDTVFAGINYQKVFSPKYGYEYFHRDSLNRIVTAYGQYMYDFGRAAGDTLIGMGYPSLSFCCIIDSVDSVFMGRYRKRVFVTCMQDCRWDTFHDVWVEGIGSLYRNSIAPFPIPFQNDDPWTDTLVCFSEYGQTIYQLYNHDCLGNILGVKEVQQSAIRLSPNPATTTLTLQSESNLPAETRFLLYDITGRMVLRQALRERTERIDVSALSKGIYLYSVVSGEEKIGVGKVVIE